MASSHSLGPIIPGGDGEEKGESSVTEADAVHVVPNMKIVLKLNSSKVKKVSASLKVPIAASRSSSGGGDGGGSKHSRSDSAWDSKGGGSADSAVSRGSKDGVGGHSTFTGNDSNANSNQKTGDNDVDDVDEGVGCDQQRSSRSRRSMSADHSDDGQARGGGAPDPGIPKTKDAKAGESAFTASSSLAATGKSSKRVANAAEGKKDGSGSSSESRKRARKAGPKETAPPKPKAGEPGSASSAEAVAAAADVAAAAALATALAPVPRSRGGAHGRHGRSYIPKNNGAITLLHTRRHFDTGARYGNDNPAIPPIHLIFF